jgi:CRP-like cAMP-binding protein
MTRRWFSASISFVDNTQQPFWYLKQIHLFEGVPDKEVKEVAKKMVEKECKKKELLYTPFEENDSICVLKKGEVTLYYSHHGKKLIIDVLEPGSVFGNLTFDEGKSGHFAEVTEDAYVCCFDSEEFMKIIQAKPKIMMRFLQIVSQRLIHSEERLKTGLFDAKEKILHHFDMLEDRKK